MMIDESAFRYPEPRRSRRHEPQYETYKSCRPWLRDEFMFRCVYCLKRETWGQVTGDFELDHFKPQKINPEKRLDYNNLVYACQRCNGTKSCRTIPDPFKLLTSERLFCDYDGHLRTDDPNVEKLIEYLDLNSPRMIRWRWQWIEVIKLAKSRKKKLYDSLMSLPNDLPDLSRLKPVANSREKGISESWLVVRNNKLNEED